MTLCKQPEKTIKTNSHSCAHTKKMWKYFKEIFNSLRRADDDADRDVTFIFFIILEVNREKRGENKVKERLKKSIWNTSLTIIFLHGWLNKHHNFSSVFSINFQIHFLTNGLSTRFFGDRSQVMSIRNFGFYMEICCFFFVRLQYSHRIA
jgi:hypothetical protein